MSLRNKLPDEYETLLAPIVRGNERYEESLLPIFNTLNPSHVASISRKMTSALWSIESQIASDRWWARPSTGVKFIMSALNARPISAPVFSVSGNGYVREMAIKKWPRINNAFELSLLLLRLNDWVQQVRSVATLKLEKLMRLPVSESGLTQDTILGCMELILDSNRFGRSREVEFRVLNQLLNMNDVPSALANYVKNSDLDSAPRYLKLALRRGILTDALPTMAQEGAHAEVRRIATIALLGGEFIWHEDRQIRHRPIDLEIDKIKVSYDALNDKSPNVQCVALSHIAEYKTDSLYNEETFRRFVKNRRPSIVERALYGLNSLGIDYIEELRENIRTNEFSIRTLELLGRHGSASDGNLIFSKTSQLSEHDEIRALGSAAKLGHITATTALETLAFGSQDDVKSRAATRKLFATTYTPSLTKILQSIHLGQNINRRGHVRLIRKLPTMKLAVALSELTQEGVSLDYSSLWRQLRKKRNTGAFSPSQKEIEQLKDSVGMGSELKAQFHKALGLSL